MGSGGSSSRCRRGRSGAGAGGAERAKGGGARPRLVRLEGVKASSRLVCEEGSERLLRLRARPGGARRAPDCLLADREAAALAPGAAGDRGPFPLPSLGRPRRRAVMTSVAAENWHGQKTHGQRGVRGGTHHPRVRALHDAQAADGRLHVRVDVRGLLRLLSTREMVRGERETQLPPRK